MPTPQLIADVSRKNLIEACLRIAANGKLTVADLALNAFVQNVLTQAALQALINHIKGKNLISRDELDLVLAKAYDDATFETNSHGLIAVPTQHATVVQR